MNQKELKNLNEKIENIYNYGCYFLSLCYVAKGRELYNIDEMTDWYDLFIKKGWMGVDCYIKDPCAILEFFTGKKYSVEKAVLKPGGLKYSKAAFVIGRWYNADTNLYHFVVMDKQDAVIWDSLVDSNTVKNGSLESYRLFYEC